MMGEGTYCLLCTFAFILTMQEHKLIHIEPEKPCRPHAGIAYGFIYKMKLALGHWGRKKVISTIGLPKNMHVC